MEHLAFSITHIILQFGEHCDGCCHRHVLIVVLLPVLAQGTGLERNFSAEVIAYDCSLGGISNHLQNPVAVVVDSVIQHASLAQSGVKHYLCGSLQVIAVVDVVHIGVLAVSLNCYKGLELIGKVEQGVRYLFHIQRLAVPFTHLLVVD